MLGLLAFTIPVSHPIRHARFLSCSNDWGNLRSNIQINPKTMTQELVDAWLVANRKLFTPYNKKPDSRETADIFSIANFYEPGKHKPSSCGRCLYNARKAIEKHAKFRD